MSKHKCRLLSLKQHFGLKLTFDQMYIFRLLFIAIEAAFQQYGNSSSIVFPFGGDEQTGYQWPVSRSHYCWFWKWSGSEVLFNITSVYYDMICFVIAMGAH